MHQGEGGFQKFSRGHEGGLKGLEERLKGA